MTGIESPGRRPCGSPAKPSGAAPASWSESHLAATNKCLAQSSKSRTGIPVTNKRPAARRNCPVARPQARPIGGSALPVFHRPLWRESSGS